MKYGNRKVVVDGRTFDSRREAVRYRELRMFERAGEIHDLKLQPVFELAPAVFLDGRKKPALRYIADFSYWTRSGEPVIEDVKGMRTAVYRIKRHLMKSVLGLDITEVE